VSNPIVRHSVQGRTATGVDEDVDALGHTEPALFVSTGASTVTTLTVVLEGAPTPDIDEWSPVQTPAGNVVQVTETDLTTDPTSGKETALVSLPGFYAGRLRARVDEIDTNGPVDAYVMTGGNSGGKGGRPTERKGTAGQ